MSSGWIDRAEVTRGLQRQAGGVAAKLGHRMGAWQGTPEAETTVARCQDCGDLATVRARSFRAAPISGAAVELRCGGPNARRSPGASRLASSSRSSTR